MIAADAVDGLAPVATQARELAAKLGSLGVVGKMVMGPGHVADVDGDIPLERWATFGSAGLRMRYRLGQALSAVALVCPDVRITECPKTK